MTDDTTHAATAAPADPTDPTDPTGHGAPAPVFEADPATDPRLQPYAKHPRTAELMVGLCLFLGFAGFCAFGALYWVGGFSHQVELEGISMGAGLFFFGFGMSAWGKYLQPRGPFEEERHEIEANDDDREALTAAIVERGTMVFRRRGFLGGILAAGSAVMGVVLAFPLLRSLGPVPGKQLDTTNWKANQLLVDLFGVPVHVDRLEYGGLLTVFPKGFEGSAIDQVVLVRPNPQGSGPGSPIVSDYHPSFATSQGPATWTPAGYVAYSKLCTHLGCPVGLYEHEYEKLLCPCHQSIFLVYEGATPVFGPAPRPLPQLPLKLDSKGYLRSRSGFLQPVGPGFWERS